jgi:hypothetical protein
MIIGFVSIRLLRLESYASVPRVDHLQLASNKIFYVSRCQSGAARPGDRRDLSVGFRHRPVPGRRVSDSTLVSKTIM